MKARMHGHGNLFVVPMSNMYATRRRPRRRLHACPRLFFYLMARTRLEHIRDMPHENL